MSIEKGNLAHQNVPKSVRLSEPDTVRTGLTPLLCEEQKLASYINLDTGQEAPPTLLLALIRQNNRQTVLGVIVSIYLPKATSELRSESRILFAGMADRYFRVGRRGLKGRKMKEFNCI